MPLLFYRRPDYLGRGNNFSAESENASYSERAKASKTHIPKQLSFAEIIKNNTLPPCSLNDFMDYLMYVEYNAEALQFFLWYCDYAERWSKIPQEKRDLCPMWDQSKITQLKTAHSHSRSNSLNEQYERMNRILSIMEKSTTKNGSLERNNSASKNYSYPRTPQLDGSHRGDAESEWQPSSVQPFREEVSKIVRHYISSSGPRQLNLTHQDRIDCINAVSLTTHPPALLPAFSAAETLLKEHSHPNFVRWSISNSNKPRVLFVHTLATFFILLGFALDAVLILSRMSRFIRLTAMPLWCIGFIFLIGMRSGVCVILHWNYKRNLRPWEQFADEELQNDGAEIGGGEKKHQRKNTDTSITSRIDPLRKPSLQSLGEANKFEGEPWVESYQKKSGWKKVFEVSITTQNEHLKAIQDRIVFRAVLWATILALGLGAGSVLIPSGDFF